jgi:CRP-like cAMP-binding protein
LITAEIKSNSTLRDIPLFSELSIEQLRNISSISKLKRFKKHDKIFNENDIYIGFYILLKGTVKVYKISSNGKESVVHIVNPLTVFADIPLFEGTDYPVSAEALEECLAMFIPKSKFLKLIQSEPEISLKMLGGFAKRLKALIVQIEDLTSMEVPNRLAKYILKEVKSSGTEKLVEPFIKLSIPKSTIASYLGTITETLSRTFKKLQNDGIIRVVGKKIFVKDLKRLKELTK